MHAYNGIIENQLNTKIIEPVLETDSILPGQVHYLQHRPIIKTTKVRIVYDASSNATGPSLNYFLCPALCKSLFGLLLRFRINSIAFISHIEKVFLQILLHPRDKDIVRFIWFKDVDKLNVNNIETAKYQIYHLCRVLFGVSSSPFLLTGALIHHMKTFSSIEPNFVYKVLKSLHFDDLYSADASIQSAYNFI